MTRRRDATVVGELQNASLGDVRRTKRLVDIARRRLARPTASLPASMGSGAAIEGCYRFVENEAIDATEILRAHAAGTQQRMEGYRCVVAIHDTTELKWRGEHREGLGPLRGSGSSRGVFMHAGLVVAPGETRVPLGLLHMHVWSRPELPVAPLADNTKKPKRRRPRGQRESQRWYEGMQRVESRCAAGVRVIHVADREADDYTLLNRLAENGQDFVIRACHDRTLETHATGPKSLSAGAEGASTRLQRDVQLSARQDGRRAPTARRIHPSRRSRRATLAIRSAAVSIKRSKGSSWKTTPASLPLNVVYVREINPPPEQPAVSWTLLTNLPIDTVEQLEVVMDYYRSRWVIEEYFKALKTGCAVESYQLRSFDALIRMLALDALIAWQLLCLRSVARDLPDESALNVLNSVQVRILLTLPGAPHGDVLNVQQAFALIAQQGGHIKNNGPPGWLTLSRGYRDLLLLETGWRAATSQKCDQS